MMIRNLKLEIGDRKYLKRLTVVAISVICSVLILKGLMLLISGITLAFASGKDFLFLLFIAFFYIALVLILLLLAMVGVLILKSILKRLDLEIVVGYALAIFLVYRFDSFRGSRSAVTDLIFGVLLLFSAYAIGWILRKYTDLLKR